MEDLRNIGIFMMIFGAGLLLAAGWIRILKDPRESIFFYRAHSLRKMPLEKAKESAKLTAKIVAIIGLGLILVFGIVFVSCI